MRLTKKEKELLRCGKAFAEDCQAYCKSRICDEDCIFARNRFCVLGEIQLSNFLDFDLEAIEE